MGHAVIRGGFDTWAGSGAPAAEHPKTPYLRLDGSNVRSFIYLRNPAPRGAVILSAVLRVHVRGTWAAQTLTARRISQSWKARRLNWNNQPSVTGVAKTATVAASTPDGTAVDFDVTQHLQTVVNGSSHYGWRIETDASSLHRLYAFNAGEHKPKLIVTWAMAPATPTDLRPSGHAVSVDKPVLGYAYDDTSATGDELVAHQVQIDPNANGSSPAWSSGWLDTTEPELDLTTTSYPGLADGASTKWRVMVRGEDGADSDWSDWESFSRDVKGTLTLDSPTAASPVVWEPTPPILASLTGETLRAYQVRVTAGDDRTRILYDSGKIRQNGGSIAHTIPFRHEGRRVLRDDHDYQVNVRAWDTKDRQATPGDPAFVHVWQTFTVDNDPGINGVTGVTAAQDGQTPWVLVEWDRATAADGYVVWRDGRRVARLEPEDVIVTGGTHYVWRDWEATPYDTHTYQVQAIENGRGSAKSATVSVRPKPEGVWILDPQRSRSFALIGNGIDDWAMADQAATYRPVGSDAAFTITTGMSGLEGSYRGTLRSFGGRTVAAQERDLLVIKEHPDDTFQLVASDTSIPVQLRDLSVGPHPDTRPSERRRLVSFVFAQNGDLPFDARV